MIDVILYWILCILFTEASRIKMYNIQDNDVFYLPEDLSSLEVFARYEDKNLQTTFDPEG